MKIKKKIELIFVLLILLSAYSCHMFDSWKEEEEITIYFEDPNLTIMNGGLAAFSLKIEPQDAYGNIGVDYKVSNNSVGQIYKGDRKGVVIKGTGEGSCIVTATLGGNEAKAVLTVTAGFGQ